MPFTGTPSNEAARLAALASYDVVGSESDAAMQALTALAARVCETRMAIVSIVGQDAQWFLSSVGLGPMKEAPRSETFCAYTILEHGVFEVPDATQDRRFADNAYVVGEPRVRFYAGQPLVDREGFALGALCVLDQDPRRLTDAQRQSLSELAVAIVGLLEGRRIASDRRNAIEAARSTAADLRAVLDAVPELVAYTDRDFRNRFANRAYAQSFGKTLEAITGLHAREVLGEAAFEATRRRFEAALAGKPQEFETEIDHKGMHRDLRITLTPDTRDGVVQGYVSTLTDVTELRDALRRSERRNDLLGMAEEIADIGHWRFDALQKRIFWSPVVFRIHGHDPGADAPDFDSALAVYHPDDRPLVEASVARALESQVAFEFEARLVRPDGEVRRVLSRGRAEVDAVTGQTTALIGVFQDITDRVALRERIERQERLVTTGTLAAGVGHEINNPLTYVAANVDFAVDELRAIAGGSPSGRLREVMDVLVEAREGAERIRKIVRGLRAFAREDAPSVPTDVHAAIEISVNMAMHELRQRATLDLFKGTIRQVFADESRLSQVFVNLLVNAAQAFPTSDTKRNRVTVSTFESEDGMVVIEVGDNGTGIPPETVERIFDPFFTTKPVGQGTGLGLSICHNVVTALGGEITFSTVVGSGTTFRVSLPAAAEDRSSRVVGRGEHELKRGRVLVIDDEESVLRALVRLLSTEHDVTSASDPRDALKRLVDNGEDFDVVFCDVMMPHVSGIELFTRVQATRPALAERFVFVTGGTVYEEVRSFLANIPNERLEKPFSNQNLKAIARRFVELAQTRGARSARA